MFNYMIDSSSIKGWEERDLIGEKVAVLSSEVVVLEESKVRWKEIFEASEGNEKITAQNMLKQIEEQLISKRRELEATKRVNVEANKYAINLEYEGPRN